MPKRKPKKKTLINKADKIARDIVKAKGYCEICGKSNGQLHCHHVIGRTNKNLRWRLENLICICAGCHKMNAGNVHDDPIEFLKWFEENRPDNYKYINKERNIIWDRDYDKVLEYLNDKLKELKEAKW